MVTGGDYGLTFVSFSPDLTTSNKLVGGHMWYQIKVAVARIYKKKSPFKKNRSEIFNFQD